MQNKTDDETNMHLNASLASEMLDAGRNDEISPLDTVTLKFVCNATTHLSMVFFGL
jgi:hypothetical protein